MGKASGTKNCSTKASRLKVEYGMAFPSLDRTEVAWTRRAVKDPGSAKGKKTQDEIIGRAMRIAAVEGLAALSIGRLAKELRMSKSGLFVHFGSKEKLEMAVVERACDI